MSARDEAAAARTRADEREMTDVSRAPASRIRCSRRERRRQIAAALAKLPERQRWCLC